MKKTVISLICSVLAFSACNKDDDGPKKDPVEETITPPEEETVAPPTVLTGVFRDSEVQGLSFTTPTQAGTTNEKGEFSYVEGETITFKVGELTLGSATAEAVMTPISLAKTVDAAASIESPMVQNMAALLQTLDQDNDHSNGISISQDIVAAIGIQTIDFSQPVESTLADIVLNVAQNEGTPLQIIYPGQAANNMAAALEIAYEAPPNYAISHLMPTLKAFLQSLEYNHTPASAVYKNTFDAEGKLLTTQVISRFSGKPFFDFNFTGHSIDGEPESGGFRVYNASRLYGANANWAIADYDLSFSYDANHNLTTWEHGINGVAYQVDQFSAFDEDNRPLSYARDFNFDDATRTQTSTNDFTYENGLIKTSKRAFYSEDNRDDYYNLFISDYDITYAYNGFDNLEEINYSYTYESTNIWNGEEQKDEGGRVTNETFDYDGSQKMTTYSIFEEVYVDGAFAHTGERTREYDENELLISYTGTSTDGNGRMEVYEAGILQAIQTSFQGLLSYETIYLVDGSTISTDYYYDEGELYVKEVYERDADFNILKRTDIWYVAGEIEYIDEFLYDTNGYIITGIYKNGEGEVQYTYNYTYNSAGEIATVEGLNADDSLWFTEEWEYENGLLSKITVYNPNGTLSAVYYYEEGQLVLGEFYDENGNLVETVDYTESAKTSSIASKRLRTFKAQEDLMANGSGLLNGTIENGTQGAMMSKKALGTKRSIHNQNEVIRQHLQISRQARNK